MTRSATADTPVSDLASSWKRRLRAEDKAPTTVRNYLLTLRHFSSWLHEQGLPDTPAEITADHITDFLLDMGERTSKTTAAFHFRNLRTFYRWLTSRQEGALLRSEDPMLDVTEPKHSAPPRPAFEDSDVAALLKTCRGNSFFDRRDEAILRVFWSTGMRIGGLVGLRYKPDCPHLDNDGLNDVFLDGRQPLLRLRLKGGKVHLVPIGAKTVMCLDRYLRARNRHPWATKPDLWISHQGGLSSSAVHAVLKRRAKQAGLATRVHAHRFRRTTTRNLLDEGVDRAYVAKLMGWSDLRNVALYASDSEQQRAWEAAAAAGIDSRV